MANGASEDIGMSLRQSVTDHAQSSRPEGRADNRAEAGFVLVTKPEPPQRDWSAALDLVREASEAIRIRDERATEMEIEHRLDAERASEDIRSLQEQLEETETRLAETEERARAAEARAADAEAWLTKMHDTIVTSFSRGLASDDVAEAELRAAFANGDLGRSA